MPPEDGVLDGQNDPAAGGEKTFSEECVKALRTEAKNNRLALRGMEASLRKALGLPEGEQIGDISGRISALGAKALETVNSRLIAAELRALEGYNHKLLARVADLSKVSVADDGSITGLKEAIAAAEKEFPEIKIKAAAQPLAPFNPAPGESGGGAENKTMNDLIRGKI